MLLYYSKQNMSGFPVKPPSTDSGFYNPAFYTASTDYLTLATAETSFVKLNDSRLSLLSGITAGQGSIGKALVLDNDLTLTGIKELTIGDDFNIGKLYIKGGSTSLVELQGNLTVYGSTSVGSINATSYLLNGSPLSMSTAPTFLIGAGDMTVSNTKLAIQNTSHTTGTVADYIHFGPHRNTSGLYGSFRISTFYQSSNQDTTSYLVIRPLNIAGSTQAGGGFCMTANGRFAFTKNNSTSIITNPAAVLEVNGSIAYSYSTGYKITNTGGSTMGTSYPANVSLQLSHSISCAEPVFITSDERLKTDIKPIPLEESRKLLKVEPVSYRWKKHEETDYREIGVIAQRVQEAGLAHLTSVLPSRDPLIEDGKQNVVMYDRIPIHLLNLVKELYVRIATLEEQLKND